MGCYRVDIRKVESFMIELEFDPSTAARLRRELSQTFHPSGWCIMRRFLRQAQDTEFIEVQG